ncbi:heavy metal-associated isoprenylated plant protein 43-like [Oryza brachyantha]|uniref:HMA domain-containing protein n=1 Tax=Oryza brachyantha TaxID=4533 RepID=J3M2A5_ORYBR|nr:heavy metal-associated isoprenylated plant protein 43-like [Oryza brachyantha]
MSKKTVLRVDTSCDKCKRKVLQAVSGLQGVDKIEIDSEKSTMTVTGSADPVDVIERTRKAGKRAEVVTVGPPASSSKPGAAGQQQKKKQQPAAEEKVQQPAAAEKRALEPPATVYVHYVPSYSWPSYEQSVVYHHQDPPPACSIM